jgi:hypothetical protein
MVGRRREAAMRSCSRLGAANLALLSLYFVPVWGVDAMRALISPYSGFEDRVHSAMANYLQHVFGFGLDGLLRASNVLAGIKLVTVAGLVAYGIEFARSLVMRREVDRATFDAVLVLTVISTVISAVPVLALEDAALVRLYATQILLVASAVIVIMVERHIEQSAPAAVAAAAVERDVERRAAAAEIISDAAAATLHPAA